jgi:hypothetical protein
MAGGVPLVSFHDKTPVFTAFVIELSSLVSLHGCFSARYTKIGLDGAAKD